MQLLDFIDKTEYVDPEDSECHNWYATYNSKRAVFHEAVLDENVTTPVTGKTVPMSHQSNDRRKPRAISGWRLHQSPPNTREKWLTVITFAICAFA